MSKSKTGIEVKLIGEDGNVFNLMGIVSKAMRRNGISKDEIEQFQNEVTSSDSYDEALQVMMRWVDVR
ncbi:hypothetical protein [Bacillus paranthracis]|uniref:hypothetical protein n=1 Tax=Bacillus paranthracis TaxID=2026186 RepID=UPI0022E09936|nr:hypothetical protein [Bacillus paranthracis]